MTRLRPSFVRSSTFVAVIVLVLGSGLARVAAQDASPSGTPDASGGATSEVTQQLPPADLPSGNLRGFDLRLNASLRTDLSKAPTEADIYRLDPQKLDEDQVKELAKALGISGTPQARGNDTWSVDGDGTLFVGPSLIQYASGETPTLSSLPKDDDAVAFARSWLQKVKLLPPDAGDGKVTSRTEAVGRVTVTFAPTTPTPILAAFPNITVIVGPDGTVLEAAVRWATITLQDHYLLRPAEDAWKDVEDGNAYIEAPFDGLDIPVGTVVKGNATYTSISIAYTTAGTPEQGQYLAPVFVFKGKMDATEGAKGSTDIAAYVPAIVQSNTPVG